MKKLIKFFAEHPFWVTIAVGIVFYFLPFKPKPFGDGEYHAGTLDLIAYIVNGFSGQVEVQKGLFPLLYYLFPYSIAYPFHDDSVFFLVGISFNVIVTAVAVRLIFDALRVLKLTINQRATLLLLLCLFPVHIYYGIGILAETPAFFAGALFVRSCVNLQYFGTNRRQAFYLAVSLVILCTTRVNLLPVLLLCSVYFAFALEGMTAKIIYFSIVLLFTGGLMMAENAIGKPAAAGFKQKVFRNQIVWSRFELRSEPFNWIPQHGVRNGSKDYFDNLAKRRELDSICEARNLDKTAYFSNWVIDDIVLHPGLTLRQYFLKFFQSQSFIISPIVHGSKPVWVKFGIHIYINTINFALLALALFGLASVWKRKLWLLFWPFFVLWGWSFVYICLFHSEQRYMFPLRPVLVLLAGFALLTLSRRFAGLHRPKTD